MNKQSSPLGYVLVTIGGALIAGLLVLHYYVGPPSPGPVPPKPPVDPAGSFLLFVMDNDNRTPEQAAVVDNDDLWKWLHDKKITRHIISKTSKAFTDFGADKILADANVPPSAVILFAPGNTSTKVAPLPLSVDALQTWIVGSPHTGPPSIVVDGVERFLTCLPPSQAKFMAPRGGEFSDVHAPIPRANWKEVNNRAKFPVSDWLYDQDGIGSCVGNGSTVAMMKCRALAGMSYMRLAPGCTYAQINGGHDGGAVISDSLTALQQTGTITSQSLGSDEKPFYLNKMPSNWKAEAARFRIEEAYHCSNYDDICTALQLGYVVVYGVMVGGNFNTFSSEGVPGYTSGPGNHCMHADGLHKLSNGKWAVDNQNSWGDWGPWKGTDHTGRCYLTEDHFLHGDQPDAYAIKGCIEDPLDPVKPPKKKVTEGTKKCPCYPCDSKNCAKDCPCQKTGKPCTADECTCKKSNTSCNCSDRCNCKDKCDCSCTDKDCKRCNPDCNCDKHITSKDPAVTLPPDGIKYEYKWKDNGKQADLYRNGKHIGSYWKPDGKYYSRDNSEDQFKVATPPVALPEYARPEQRQQSFVPLPSFNYSTGGGCVSG